MSLETLLQTLNSGEKRALSLSLKSQLSLKQEYDDAVKEPRAKQLSSLNNARIQARHQLFDHTLDLLSASDEPDNYSIALLRKLQHFEVLLSRNLISDAKKLINSLKVKAIKEQDRIYLPEILLKQAYLMRFSSNPTEQAAIAEELKFWQYVREIDLQLADLSLSAKQEISTTEIIKKTALIEQKLSLQGLPISLKQDAYLQLAKLYHQKEMHKESNLYFSKAAELLAAESSEGKSLRRLCLVLAEWLLHHPSAELAERLSNQVPSTVSQEERAEQLRQWLLLLINWCLGNYLDREQWSHLIRLPLEHRQLSLTLGLSQALSSHNFRVAHQLLIYFQGVLEPKNEALLSAYILTKLENYDGAMVWINTLKRQKAITSSEFNKWQSFINSKESPSHNAEQMVTLISSPYLHSLLIPGF